MRKHIISLVFALMFCLLINPLSVLAAGTVTVTYSGGNVTITGSGFEPDTEYFVRILDENQTHLIAMLTVMSDSSGRITAGMSVGTLENGAYNALVNDASGDAAGSSSFQVSSGGGGGGGGGSGSSGGGHSSRSEGGF